MEKNELEKDEIQKKHDKLTSILQDAHKALNSINKKDVNEIKSFTFPPTLIKLTMQCILILLGRKTSVKAVNKIFPFRIYFFLFSRKRILLSRKSGMSQENY